MRSQKQIFAIANTIHQFLIKKKSSFFSCSRSRFIPSSNITYINNKEHTNCICL